MKKPVTAGTNVDNNNTKPSEKVEPDHIISADWIIPMTQVDHWLEKYAIVLSGSQIVDLIPQSEISSQYPEINHTCLSGQVLMPGLINAHCHGAMNLLRGLSDDLPLKQWLEQEIWPVEGQFVDDSFIYQGTQHAIAELLRSGTTCFQDMYFIPEQIARAVQETGIRASIGMVVMDMKTNWTNNAQDCIDQGLSVFDQYKHSSLLSFNFAPHAPYTVAKNTLEKLVMLSNELNLPVQIHAHETRDEIESFLNTHSIRPMTMMKEIGMLSPLLNAVHMTQLNETEIEWLAESGSHVIHCPQSNMKLASGTCPVTKLINQGVNVAIGTDGAASNNDLDMIDEMRSASLLAKLSSEKPTSLTAYQTLFAATAGGAKALGLQNQIGTLEKGKAADIISINLNTIETQPVYNPVSQIVYAASRNQVSHVWVNGKLLLEKGNLKTLNSDTILQQAQQWRDRIVNR